MSFKVDSARNRFPFCIVWTPIPMLTWIFPFLGHIGIATSTGVIKDFAGSYYISVDNMAFGKPCRYLQLNPEKASGGIAGWDHAIEYSCEVYTQRVHNLFCDNCHSHVALALSNMNYNQDSNWNMFKLAFQMFLFGKYVNFIGFLKTWLPFIIIVILPIIYFSLA